MAEITCGYAGDRDEVLVAYVYDEITSAERAVFDVHLARCAPCRAELGELRGVRARLGQWAPLLPQRASAGATAGQDRRAGGRTRLGDVPVWAQVAAALLFVGIAAGAANLDVRYDREGLRLRTGWSKVNPPVAEHAGAARTSDAGTSAGAAPWRADLMVLERQLRTEFRGSTPTPIVRDGAHDAETVRRVRALIEESERKQQRELALRVAEILRDVNAQRQADLVKIDRSLGLMQNNTGVEVMKQRELLNYLVRVSQKQ